MIFTLSFTRTLFKRFTKIISFSHIKSGLYISSIIFFSSGTLGADTYPQQSGKYPLAHTSNHLLLASNDTISPEQAASIAKQGKDSKVLKISKKVDGNRDLYRVKLLTPKGHVRLVLVDARTGEIVQGTK